MSGVTSTFSEEENVESLVPVAKISYATTTGASSLWSRELSLSVRPRLSRRTTLGAVVV